MNNETTRAERRKCVSEKRNLRNVRHYCRHHHRLLRRKLSPLIGAGLNPLVTTKSCQPPNTAARLFSCWHYHSDFVVLKSPQAVILIFRLQYGAGPYIPASDHTAKKAGFRAVERRNPILVSNSCCSFGVTMKPRSEMGTMRQQRDLHSKLQDLSSGFTNVRLIDVLRQFISQLEQHTRALR
jgi:hypothetical protein